MIALLLQAICAADPFLFSGERLHSAQMVKQISQTLQESQALKGEAYFQALDRAVERQQVTIEMSEPSSQIEPYTYGKARTYVVAKPYKRDGVEQWSLSTATATAIGGEGVFVTNFHVLEHKVEEGLMVISSDWEMYPLTEILVADPAHDFAVFKVALPPQVTIPSYPIATSAVGERVHLVSHPQHHHYFYHQGYISGYKEGKSTAPGYKPRVVWMYTELGYVTGSSGGGIFNDHGGLVGMVSHSWPEYGNASKRG